MRRRAAEEYWRRGGGWRGPREHRRCRSGVPKKERLTQKAVIIDRAVRSVHTDDMSKHVCAGWYNPCVKRKGGARTVGSMHPRREHPVEGVGGGGTGGGVRYLIVKRGRDRTGGGVRILIVKRGGTRVLGLRYRIVFGLIFYYKVTMGAAQQGNN